MIPFVLLITPLIRRAVDMLTRESADSTSKI
jgi:hypothetical protein